MRVCFEKAATAHAPLLPQVERVIQLDYQEPEGPLRVINNVEITVIAGGDDKMHMTGIADMVGIGAADSCDLVDDSITPNEAEGRDFSLVVGSFKSGKHRCDVYFFVTSDHRLTEIVFICSLYGFVKPMVQPRYDLTRNVHRICLYNTVTADHQHTSNRIPRLYLHVDMNCFYAQVEQSCYNLFGLPVIVGGWRKDNGTPRGIVATSSYEARAFGVRTGMSHLEATQLCPYLVPLQVHWEKYQAISAEVREILTSFSPSVESYSSDEAFLDITYMIGKPRGEIEALGAAVKNRIYHEVGLLCSIGIARSKTYSKLASDLIKPNGLVVVLTPEDAVDKIYPLSLKEVWGIGRRRFARLQEEGLHTIADAVDRGPGGFQKLFGAFFGQMLWETTIGRDCARILDEEEHIPREVGYMHTFSDWTDDPLRVCGEIGKAVQQLCYRMRGCSRRAERFSCHIRFQDDHWRGVDFTFTTPGLTNLDDYVLEACLHQGYPIICRFLAAGQTIRGIGLNTVNLTDNRQLELFFREQSKTLNLYTAIDAINNRFGMGTLNKASVLYAVEGKTHFLERNSLRM